MPRSSGGGSHRSGSHSSHSSNRSSSRSSGGGSHRSGSHYSSSSGSRGYNRSTEASSSFLGQSWRTSSQPFAGSQKYVRYGKNGKPIYMYSNMNPAAYKGGIGLKIFRAAMIFIAIILALMMVLFIAVGASEGKAPSKLSQNYETGIVITDSAEVLGDTSQLESSMENFYDKTGITPVLVTVHNEDWNIYFDSLEGYAYDLYVNMFDDESHWLLIYSQPQDPDPAFNDWYFEGMQGDDTVEILTDSITRDFTDAVFEGLSKNTVSVSEAFAAALDTTASVSMEKNQSMITGAIAMTIIFAIPFVIVVALCVIIPKKIRKRFAEYKKCEEAYDSNPLSSTEKNNQTINQERNCIYCGGLYIRGTVVECPHCGAPINAEQDQ